MEFEDIIIWVFAVGFVLPFISNGIPEIIIAGILLILESFALAILPLSLAAIVPETCWKVFDDYHYYKKEDK